MKKIWIFNHYAVPPGYRGESRLFQFARILRDRGYEPVIFSSSFLHGTETDLLDGLEADSVMRVYEGIPFVHVRTRRYKGNGADRIRGMADYYRMVKRAAKDMEPPYAIYASSPHPLALLAAIKLARRFSVRCVCEVRDLWPESFVAYGMLDARSPVLKVLYAAEHYLYRACDALVFTMPNGAAYLAERGWTDVDPAKAASVNNGIDVASFDALANAPSPYARKIAASPGFSLAYCGTVADTHPLLPLIKAVEQLCQEGACDVSLHVFGDGDQKDELERYCKDHAVGAVRFEGAVDHDLVPSIMHAADANVISVAPSDLSRFGISWLKLPECLAAGKPILMTSEFPHNPVIDEECGVQADGTVDDMKRKIQRLCSLDAVAYRRMCGNARRAAQSYDMRVLASKLERVIEGK